MNLRSSAVTRLRIRVIFSVYIAAAAAAAGATETESRRLTLADLGSRVSVSAAAVSPDGKRVAVLTSRANFADNRFENSLVIVDTASGEQQPIPAARANASSPQWSPQSDRLAWLESESGQPPQIVVLSLNLPGARPVRITNAAKGVGTGVAGFESYAWSPDGQSFTYISADPQEVRQGDERHNKSFEVVDNDYLATEGPVSFRAWLVAAAGGDPKRLTNGPESVSGVGWFYDAKSVIVVSRPGPISNGIDGSVEFLGSFSGSAVVKSIAIESTTQTVMVGSQARIMSTPRAAPNGEVFAYRRFQGPEPWVRPNDIAVLGKSGGDVRDLTSALDRDIAEFAWLPDSKSIVIAAPDGTRSALWQQPLNGPARRLDLGSVVEISSLSSSNTGVIAFIGTEAGRPAELYVMQSIKSKPRRLTNFNQLVASFDMGRTETIRWQLDGFEQTGVLTYPPGFTPGEKIPLVLNIHGGPEGTSTEAFSFFDQVLAGRGWAIFKPNYRGSNSQGAAFQSAVANDLGDGPGRDVMAGLAAVKAKGFVDEGRIAVSGWSYGGYMTAWLIGHYQGWRVAVAGAPLTNLVDWYDLSCCGVWAEGVLGGSPWINNNFANYWRQSPIAYADKFKTPTLILHRMGDSMAPLTQSYNLYRALKDNGIPVKFVVYPVDGHGYRHDPIHERDTLRRWIEWIDEHFQSPMPVSY